MEAVSAVEVVAAVAEGRRKGWLENKVFPGTGSAEGRVVGLLGLRVVMREGGKASVGDVCAEKTGSR